MKCLRFSFGTELAFANVPYICNFSSWIQCCEVNWDERFWWWPRENWIRNQHQCVVFWKILFECGNWVVGTIVSLPLWKSKMVVLKRETPSFSLVCDVCMGQLTMPNLAYEQLSECKGFQIVVGPRIFGDERFFCNLHLAWRHDVYEFMI